MAYPVFSDPSAIIDNTTLDPNLKTIIQSVMNVITNQYIRVRNRSDYDFYKMFSIDSSSYDRNCVSFNVYSCEWNFPAGLSTSHGFSIFVFQVTMNTTSGSYVQVPEIISTTYGRTHCKLLYCYSTVDGLLSQERTDMSKFDYSFTIPPDTKTNTVTFVCLASVF